MDLSFEEVVIAYLDCRRRKRRGMYAIDFEFDMERNLFQLYEDLLSGTYKIGESIAFIVEQPKIREIWAATFRDRVVHHVIYNRLSPRFYPTFIRNSFACIPDRGSLDASNYLWSGMRSITDNWRRGSYFLGADIKNFFVSIHKETLFEILKEKIHEPWLLALTQQVLFHDPRINCELHSKQEAFGRVPKHKSLWHIPEGRGLPIGNLTSQFFANVYLNELDQFVKHQLRVKYYYRYVDDFIFLDESPATLNHYFREIQIFLENRLMLELHPFKKRLGRVDQGVDFVGYFHKPYRRYARKRTVNRLKSRVNLWKKDESAKAEYSLINFRNSVNSYFGLIGHTASYRLRKSICQSVLAPNIGSDEKFQKLMILKMK